MLAPVAVHQVAVEAGARVVELTRSKFQPQSCFCVSIAIFDRFGIFLLTWSTDDFPWAGCTVVGQVSKLHLRGSPALFAKARPIVMIFQMPQTYLDKKTNTEVGTKSFTSTWSTSHSPKPSSPLTALKWEITSLISFGPPP